MSYNSPDNYCAKKIFVKKNIVCYYASMFNRLKTILDKKLYELSTQIDRKYRLKKISPLLYANIVDFICRDGKRIRPILFIIGYNLYSSRTPENLYTSALSLELLHDFLLIHDDIIDKSNLRRGKPAMHTMFNTYLKNKTRVKFTGNDLAIVTGDILYALSLDTFLSVHCNAQKKEKALNQFLKSSVYTGSGEFIELIFTIEKISQITKPDIYKIYDLKTSYYTFASPLITGAILAGANEKETKKLLQYGLCLGRAFQIKDDLWGMFEPEEKTGKSGLSDLQEGKRTLLLWHTYNNCSYADKKIIETIYKKELPTNNDLLIIRKIMDNTNTRVYAQKEINRLINNAKKISAALQTNQNKKLLLSNYMNKILNLEEIVNCKH